MVHSPNYDRLMRFVDVAKSNESLSGLDAKHRTAMEAIREAEERIQHYREYQGFEGKTGDAIKMWLDKAKQSLEEWRTAYLAATLVEIEMRRVMQHAREEAELLSPVLVDSRLDTLRDMADVVIPVSQGVGGPLGFGVNALASTGAAAYDAIAAQANAEREQKSKEILHKLNDSMHQLAAHARDVAQPRKGMKRISKKGRSTSIHDLNDISAPWVIKDIVNGDKSASPDQPGVYPGDRDSDYGRADQRGANSGAYPSGYDDPSVEGADAERLRKMQSQRIADKFTTEGELGSRSKPITDPKDLMGVDLLHSRIGGERYANGLTRGGYTPAPPSDRHHPLWRINGGPSTRFDASGRTSLAGAGALGAGVLGAGALGAAALGARGGSGLGAGSLGALGRGGAGGLGASGRGGGLGAGGLGRGGAGGLGASGRGGLGAGSLGGLRGGSASGSGFGSSGLPGSTSASGGTPGLTGANGAGGAAGAAGKAGGGSAAGGAGAAGRPGMGGFMGAGAGAGAGGSKDDKKGRRRKYAAFKFEDDEDDALPPGYVNPMSQTYGSDKDLKPASQKDDGWDPRQW